MRTPSPYQQAIFDFIARRGGSAIVKAAAGSGKTTTAVEALKLISPDDSVLFLAFNKSIAKELQARSPEFVDCRTTHSLGWDAVRRWSRKAQLQEDKNTEILKHFAEKELITEEEYFNLGYTVKRIVGLAKAEGLVPDGAEGESLVEDTEENWSRLFSHYDVELPNADVFNFEEQRAMQARIVELAKAVLTKGLTAKWMFDFDDMIYVPTVKKLPFDKYDWVFVDEAQDLSGVQHKMLSLVMKPDSRLIAIGDPNQAIYSFRGANSNSMNMLAEAFRCQEFPLSITYRCPRSVVREAQEYVPEIEAAPNAPEGEVREIVGLKMEMFAPGDLVVCRINAPLVKLAYKMILAKKPAHVMGRNIGQGLTSLIRKLRPRTLEHLQEKMTAWKDREIEKLRKKDPDADETKIMDKFECMMTFIENSPAQTVRELQSEIEEMFHDKEESDKILLSSVHRAKGLEADRVFILDFWMLEKGNPRREKRPHQVQERKNLAYVALTRAKKALFFIDSKELNLSTDGKNMKRERRSISEAEAMIRGTSMSPLEQSLEDLKDKHDIRDDENVFEYEEEEDQ